jgi:DNA invertase Pin-like site-specific DNA recombinase
MENYIVYRRKSSGEDKQIASLESQQEDLKITIPNYDKLNIIANFDEKKSAKSPGRIKFNEMCVMLQQGKANNIVCWALNRLARNSVDGGLIIWLVQDRGLKIITPSKTYDRNDVLLMYVEFAMANQFVTDLGKSTRRGLKDKITSGDAPIYAPIGYINDTSKKQGCGTSIDRTI